MKILKVNQEEPELAIIKKACQVLIEEDIIIHPTETVYGIAGLFSSEKAIQKILELKQRLYSQPFSIMVNNTTQIFHISGIFTSEWVEQILHRLLPGPITVILPRLKKLGNDYWDQFPGLGFRFPLHVLSRKLVEMAGNPLISTSANLSGKAPAIEIDDVSPDLLQKIPLILDGGATQEKKSSTIIEIQLEPRKIKLHREGSISLQEIQTQIKDLL
jgi:L-threonylcarbamoyladenylate synthase